MIYAMSAGTKGMLDNSNALGVVGSNISNVNTVGFKTGTDSFASYFANAMTWGTGDSWNQGSIQTTGKETDLAINGKGLFMVSDMRDRPIIPGPELLILMRMGIW